MQHFGKSSNTGKAINRKGTAEMPGKGRQIPRKPATKFTHLRKKMEKARPVAKIRKKT
jgi:hypothetical protein